LTSITFQQIEQPFRSERVKSDLSVRKNTLMLESDNSQFLVNGLFIATLMKGFGKYSK